MRKYYIESRKTGYPTYNKGGNDNLIGHILLRICLIRFIMEEKIKERIKVMGRE
jgi:hypothetical protein